MTPPAGRAIDVLSMGRSCIDLYAREIGVPITDVTAFNAFVGGCPTNLAVGARRLGLRTELLTAVGDDPVGEFVLHFLDREGVGTRHVPHKAGRRTSAALVTIQPPDTFSLTYYRDNCADVMLSVRDVDATPIAGARVLFLSGTGLCAEPSATATRYAAETARAAGTTVVVDLDYRAALWPDPETFGAAVRTLLRQADLALGTREEVRAAAGGTGTDDDAIACVLGTGVAALAYKRGADGATLYRRDGAPVDAAPFHVEVLNVLGAGDAFASGLLYAWLSGWPLDRALRFGNATGAIVVTRHGCANDMPTRAEVEAFVASHGGW